MEEEKKKSSYDELKHKLRKDLLYAQELCITEIGDLLDIYESLEAALKIGEICEEAGNKMRKKNND